MFASLSAALPDDWSLITSHEPLNKILYPLLSQTDRAWHIVNRPLTAVAADVPEAVAFGLDAPTLRWVRDDGVTDIYIDGMTTADFLEAAGLDLSLHKGAYVLSKRLSRVLRPYYVNGLFAPEDVDIRYLDELDRNGLKVWDGAGVISRKMLRKMMLSEDLPPAKRARLERELRHAQRVEFTILTANGQDKGHAMVSDDLDVDFLLSRDIKGEIKLTDGHTFVGIDFVHGKKEMRLDIQSLINLHPFFEEDQLLAWLKQEGELFLKSVEEGSVGGVLGRIDTAGTLEDVTGWHVREFLACGGQPMWSPTLVKSVVGQHLKRLRHSTLNKLRLPIPGGRQYVMPAGVGQAAGLALAIPRGQIQLDPERATAWVNDEDWVSLADSPTGAGIADILGGADNDDALWVHPFTDHDGEKKVLAWRSPNQVGEHITLRPTEDSSALTWETAVSPISFPAADSRKLPPRTDHTQPDYLHLVGANGRLPEQTYTIDALDEAIVQAELNQGILGMTCNSLMVHKALFNSLPKHPPAPLEDVVDAAVKTGADLSQVKAWNLAHTQALLQRKVPIPDLLRGRLCYDRENPSPPPPVSEGHWLDRVESGVQAHIQAVVTKRDALMKMAAPPVEVVDSVTPEDIKRGAGLNQVYGRTLRELVQKRPFRLPTQEDLDKVRKASVNYLSRFHPTQHPSILRGAMVSASTGKRRGSDAVCWQPGEDGHIGLAQKSLAALREVRVLDGIEAVDGRLLVHPHADVAE